MSVTNVKTTTKIFLSEELVFVEEKDRYSEVEYTENVSDLVKYLRKLFCDMYNFKTSLIKDTTDNSVEYDIYLIPKEENNGEEENPEKAEEIHDNPDYPGDEEMPAVSE